MELNGIQLELVKYSPPKSDEPLLTLEEVADRIKLAPETVRKHLSNGLPHRRISQNAVRFYYSEVQQWVDRRHAERTQGADQ